MGRAAFLVAGLIALVAATVGVAASLAAPSATTGPVSNVAATSATVSGTVNPGGESTTTYVEYGTTTGYGKKTSSKSAGAGSSSVSVSADLTSLASSTTYHYRVVASNSSGTVHGADGIVTTLAAPVPGVSTSDADEIGPFKAKLHGAVDPNGGSTTWYFEYGKSTSYGTKTSTQNAGSGTSPLGVSVLVQGLEAGVAYHFRLVASNGAGTSRSSDRTFVTDGPPSVKTGSASSITATSAVVSGTVNPRNRGSSTWFEYGTSTSYGANTAVQDAGFGTTDKPFSATLASLRPGTTYHFRIVGKSDAGTVFGSDASFKTSAVPAVVTGPLSSIGADRVTFNGTVNPNGRSTAFFFQIGATTHYSARTATVRVGSGTSPVPVTATITGLGPATTYHYRLVAYNSAGVTRGPDATFQTLGPPTEETRMITNLSTSTAVVWGRVNARGIAGTYWLEFGRNTSYGQRTPTGSVPAGSGEITVSFPLSGLQPGVRYHVRVVAANAAGTTFGRDASFATPPLPRSPSGRVVQCTIVGTVGPDKLRGTPGPDVICGLGGNDVIHGLGGNDVVYAGAGDDVVDGGSGNDVVYGGGGNDRLAGGMGRDQLSGGLGHDLLQGGPGRDLLISRHGGEDIVNGGPGRDRGRIDRGLDVRISVERLLS
jgi:hypothetical protein